MFGAAVIGAALLTDAPVSAFGHASDPLNQDTNGQSTRKRSARKPAAEPISCPAGTFYARIRSGGLIFKKTHFEGCGTALQINYHQAEADRADRNRWAASRAINDAAQQYNRSIQQSQPRSCTTNVFGSTAYSNCY